VTLGIGMDTNSFNSTATNVPAFGTAVTYNGGSGVVVTGFIYSVTGTAVNDTITTGGGADTIVGNGGSDTIVSGAGADSITTGAAACTITPGTGADTVTLGASNGVSDTVIIVSGDTTSTIGGGATNAGTITGFDVITNFTANSDILNLPGTVAASTISVASLASGNGTDSTLITSAGAGSVVGAHTLVSSGLYTFQVGTAGATGTLTINSAATLAATVQYIAANDFGDAGVVLAFNGSTDGGVTASTFIYQQTTTNTGVSGGYELVQLIGTLSGVATTAAAGLATIS
jgi:hypothetical protein